MQDICEKAPDWMVETGSILHTGGRYAIHLLTIIGLIEGHTLAPEGQKATKYEHVIPQLIAAQEDPATDGILIILNTVGGDVEAGLALAELIAGLTKPTATLVLGGGHSIGIPLAVSAQCSFIVPTATMTVHPVRHTGVLLGVPETMTYFAEMQERITDFVCRHARISPERFRALMQQNGQLVLDVGTMLNGQQAVEEGLIDRLGTVKDALAWLYQQIETEKGQPSTRPANCAAADSAAPSENFCVVNCRPVRVAGRPPRAPGCSS